MIKLHHKKIKLSHKQTSYCSASVSWRLWLIWVSYEFCKTFMTFCIIEIARKLLDLEALGGTCVPIICLTLLFCLNKQQYHSPIQAISRKFWYSLPQEKFKINCQEPAMVPVSQTTEVPRHFSRWIRNLWNSLYLPSALSPGWPVIVADHWLFRFRVAHASDWS